VLDAQGWSTLLARVAELQASKHGPFDLLLVLGAPPEPLRESQPPLPTLVLDGQHARIVDCEGVKVGVVPESALVGIEGRVDVLITAKPPLGFHRATALPMHIKGDMESTGHPVASLSALASKPKYHFTCGLGCFFQRAPYNNGDGVTRLVFLAAVGAAKPASPELKWLHALNLPLEPADKADALKPDVTPNPYEQPQERTKRARSDDAATPMQQQFFFASSGQGRGARRRQQPKVPPRMDCWFCLASPSCEKHLIAGVGEEMYVALPKGGIQVEHLLVVPVTHEDAFATMAVEALDETARHMDAIAAWFSSRGFACLFWERSIVFGKAAQRHCYIEALPVPVAALPECDNAFNAQQGRRREREGKPRSSAG